MRMRDSTVLVPGRMDGDIAFEVTGERHRILYSDRYRVSGVSDGEGYWFDETFERDPIRVGASTGWFDLDEDGVRSDVVLRIEAHPLRVRTAPGVERWTIAPRVLPAGWWTVRDERDGTLLIRASGTAIVEAQVRPVNPVRPSQLVHAAMLTPLVVGLPAHVFPISPEGVGERTTAPIRSIERVRFDTWRSL